LVQSAKDDSDSSVRKKTHQKAVVPSREAKP
jgi:hypothetical protein